MLDTLSRPTTDIQHKSLPISCIIVDPQYQRALDTRRVDKMEAEFNPRLLGTIEISARDNGEFAAFDGRHRLELARRLGLESLPCVVHYGLSPQDEALLFIQLQKKRKNVAPVDSFKAQLFAGDEEAIAINSIISGCGYRVGDLPNGNHIRAIVDATTIFRRHGGEILRDTLRFVTDLWDGCDKALSGTFLKANAEFLKNFGPRVEPKHRERLQSILPAIIIRDAGVEAIGGGRAHYLIANRIRAITKLRALETHKRTPVAE